MRHPPKPRLVFRVGVVGHRPNRLGSADPAALCGQLRSILALVRDEVRTFGASSPELFADGQPVLRAISPLAEGSDRLFADQALDLGYELCCTMPFLQEEFEKDFAPGSALEPDSLDRFHSLLERANRETSLVTFEMDGARTAPEDAYGACGRVLLNQSDLLVVVWDGNRLGKRGGTEETFDEARRRGVPIVWVDAHAPHHFQLIDSVSQLPSGGSERQVPTPVDDRPAVQAVVRQAVILPTDGTPSGQKKGPRRTSIADFNAERQRRWNPAPAWGVFKTLVTTFRLTTPTLTVEEYETAVLAEWPRDTSTAHGRVVDHLRSFYAWPDGLAVVYSNLYRSAFVLVYLMAAFAVGMALLPLAFGLEVYEPHLSETLLVAAELLLILAILAIVSVGRRRKWHERFVDYRLAAELVRHLRISAPLGSTRPFPQMPAQLKNYGHPATTWMAWYVRAVERDIGLPHVRLDVTHLSACASDLQKLVVGQEQYHDGSADGSHRLERRLHRAGFALFVATAVACATHLVAGAGTPAAWVLGVLIFAAGFLPALGSAFAGISNHGEFARLAKRSRGMQQRFSEISSHVKAFSDQLPHACPSGTSRELTALASETAQLMVNEVLDWRIVFLDRPLREP